VVVASRFDPPLPLARMRARGQLTEIRLRDLRCTPVEADALVAGVARLPAEVTGRLLERTEGWPAGLHLGAVTLREATDREAVEATIVGSQRHILDYFTEEVIGGLDRDQRDLLVRCSVLERVSGPLCDTVLGTSGSLGVLERLERSDLFVAALGDGWYRCHRLFRDVLRRELDTLAPELAPQILVRAADWFLQEGRVEDAVSHRLAAGDRSGALHLLRTQGRWFLDHGAMSAYLRLGERLADGARDPRFLLGLAFAAQLSGQPDRAAEWMRAAEPLVDEDSEPLPGWHSLAAATDTFRAVYESAGDGEAALRYARRAAERENDPQLWGYLVARQSLAVALMGAGSMSEAAGVLAECWRSPLRSQLPPLLFLQIAGQLALALQEIGDVDGTRRVSAEVAARAARAEREWGSGAAAAVGVLRLAEARVVAEADPAAALPLLRRVVDLAETWGEPSVTVTALTDLAAAEWAAGSRADARAYLARARDVADGEYVRPAAVRELQELEDRIGRAAARTARSRGALAEELTDRELAVLRALRGPLSTREIGSELYLSINTVKGYTKSLYRKLGVVSRSEAVHRGQELGLI
jgi:LuxR family maltose regulon positive regulatory protein